MCHWGWHFGFDPLPSTFVPCMTYFCPSVCLCLFSHTPFWPSTKIRLDKLSWNLTRHCIYTYVAGDVHYLHNVALKNVICHYQTWKMSPDIIFVYLYHFHNVQFLSSVSKSFCSKKTVNETFIIFVIENRKPILFNCWTYKYWKLCQNSFL